jgi:hypothetical protein
MIEPLCAVNCSHKASHIVPESRLDYSTAHRSEETRLESAQGGSSMWIMIYGDGRWGGGKFKERSEQKGETEGEVLFKNVNS